MKTKRKTRTVPLEMPEGLNDHVERLAIVSNWPKSRTIIHLILIGISHLYRDPETTNELTTEFDTEVQITRVRSEDEKIAKGKASKNENHTTT